MWQGVHEGLSAKKASRSAREWTAFPLWRVWQALQDHCTCEGASKSPFRWAAVFLSEVWQAVQDKGMPPSQQACLQIFLSRARVWEKLGGFAPERTNASSPASCKSRSSRRSFWFNGEKRGSLNIHSHLWRNCSFMCGKNYIIIIKPSIYRLLHEKSSSKMLTFTLEANILVAWVCPSL